MRERSNSVHPDLRDLVRQAGGVKVVVDRLNERAGGSYPPPYYAARIQGWLHNNRVPVKEARNLAAVLGNGVTEADIRPDAFA